MEHAKHGQGTGPKAQLKAAALWIVQASHTRGFWLFGVAPMLWAYVALLAATGTLGAQHIAVVGLPLGLAYLPPKKQRILRLLWPYMGAGLFYDSLRFVISFFHRLVGVHVDGPYRLESFLFGVRGSDGVVRLPTQILANYAAPYFDVLAAFAYVNYLYEVLGLGILLALSRSKVHGRLCLRMGLSFLLVATFGHTIWAIYPAAPPWYAEMYGLGPAILDAPSSAARLLDVDALLGIDYFRNFYKMSTNVFGAMPSLHAAFPMVAWLSLRTHFARLQIGLFLFWALMSFSAVYLGHHYVIDVLMGSMLAWLSCACIRKVEPWLYGADEDGKARA